MMKLKKNQLKISKKDLNQLDLACLILDFSLETGITS